MVLMGDFNVHSPCWDPRSTEWTDAVYWEEIIDQHGLVNVIDCHLTHY